jgi:hypothetical protein
MNGPQGPSPAIRRRRPILLIGVSVVLAVLVGGTAYWALACPCDRMPGLYLRGVEASEPVTDWMFANQVPLCQVQVDTGLLPHALNLNCMATSTGDLYLSCADCASKRWSNSAVENNQARLRLNDTVYPVTLTRVLNPEELDLAWNARAAKTGGPSDTPRPDSWWSFRVVSR